MCNDLIGKAIAEAGFPCDLEPEHLSRSDGKRPDGLSLIPWKQGENLIWDFTYSDTLCSSHYSQTSKTARKAADMAEKEKEDKYKELAQEFNFTPIAVEILGS